LLPRSAVTLLSPRQDHHEIVAAFRAGLFDFLTLPLDRSEIRTVIYRLKLHGAIQVGSWNPERAVLHLFSRPESFRDIEDISTALNQYLGLFFKVEKELHFTSAEKLLPSLQQKLDFSERQLKRIKRFILDKTGLIFGLRFIGDKFYFLVKSGDDRISYLVAENISGYPIKDVLSDYLSNGLKTSLSIQGESKR